ncbi:hypothetical protein COCOBI_02-6620 [Coccomyxa sp. Obi]|nr:hypothetical protein COCOBI_02-6620 [Coccomyxa sp. Obi]
MPTMASHSEAHHESILSRGEQAPVQLAEQRKSQAQSRTVCRIDEDNALDPTWDMSWEEDPLEAAKPKDQEPLNQVRQPWQPVLEEISIVGPEAEKEMQEIRDAVADFGKIGTAEGKITGMTEEIWQQQCDTLLERQGDFRAAKPRRHLAACKEYWQQPGPLRVGLPCSSRFEPKMQAKILNEGLRLHFVRPDSPSQQLHPQFKKRLEIGKRLIAMVRPAVEVQPTLEADRPQLADFTNHASLTEHADFVMAQADAMFKSGALKKWPVDAQPPTVISPLGVVEQPSKLRVIFDGRYVNLWEKYVSFSYERLTDVAEWMQPGFHLWTTDFTSGYHHIAVHPDYWKYLGCRLPDGTVCCFTVLPFGLSSGCRVFTTMMRKVYRPMREAGIRLSFLIDDELGGAEGLEEALFQLWILLRVLVALGWFLGKHKCQLWPQLQGKFLGMIARTSLILWPTGPEEMVFEVPQEKLQLLIQLMTETLQQEQVSARTLAKIAGKLLAMAPAFELAKPYTRSLYAALQGQQVAWDELHAYEGAWRHELQWLLKVLPAINGRRILKREDTVFLAGDAGETGLAVYSMECELPTPIISTWDDEQLERMRRVPADFSSTMREMLAVLYALQCIRADESLRAQFEHRRLIYQTDSQVMEADINKMGGNPRLQGTVKQIWELAFEMDIGLEVRWHSRWEANQVLADQLEKQEDSSDWVMPYATLAEVLSNAACAGRSFTLDVFASDTNTRVQGRFYSKWLCKGTLGVDAFVQPWVTIRGQRQFCWINGPFSQMGRIIKKIREERCDAVLIYPRGAAHWLGMLKYLPVRDTVLIPASRIQRGHRLPKAKTDLRGTRLGAAIIIW